MINTIVGGSVDMAYVAIDQLRENQRNHLLLESRLILFPNDNFPNNTYPYLGTSETSPIYNNPPKTSSP
jgi:hypothetical protein